MGDGAEFDFDRLRWWWFIDRNAHADPDANCDAHADCDANAHAHANCDTYADSRSRSYANRSRMSDWGLQISDPCNGQFASYSRSILRCSSWVLELERAIGGCSSRAFQ